MPLKFTRIVYRTAICPQESANLLPENFLLDICQQLVVKKTSMLSGTLHVSVRNRQNDMLTVTALQNAFRTIYVYARIYRKVKPLARLQMRNSRSRSAPAVVPVAPIV